ncbi:hypothetical protein BDP81DRAFT_127831 [Colletotrichum phormii]|uniref:Uncharacterized protein n=1 Tax=Colletotrichum phormii TaxID=359342 RepID=A0AAJ0ELJ2_9PEZI|nr:uncharacterized protein BDP81DRAFT_127831 [Colletotrichum phormii]KAK1641126.1 hypothetical protein BDP81DRAFT_127831 [Colletotrichum phormii]
MGGGGGVVPPFCFLVFWFRPVALIIIYLHAKRLRKLASLNGRWLGQTDLVWIGSMPMCRGKTGRYRSEQMRPMKKEVRFIVVCDRIPFYVRDLSKRKGVGC